ncbi:MAG TPA: hypothetical protein VL401_01955 [Alphaproteobacteria bacterium]|jgi:hypothetical protein|nr:hypothetical protein [Alphaproteobacteria bacterium]
MNYKGVIIEESLANKDILKDIKILKTEIEKVTPEHETPWISQWTKHTVEISEDQAKEIANKISKSLDHNHGGSWYADFKNNSHHYIIFLNKFFYINRKNKEEYEEAGKYALSLGIPEHQIINPEGEYNDTI